MTMALFPRVLSLVGVAASFVGAMVTMGQAEASEPWAELSAELAVEPATACAAHLQPQGAPSTAAQVCLWQGFDLSAADVFAQTILAQTALAQTVLAQMPERSESTDTDPADPAYLLPNPRGRLRIPLGDRDFALGFGSLLQEPTALEGATRIPTVNAENNLVGGLSIPVYGGTRLGTNQALLVESLVGLRSLDFDVSYFVVPADWPGALALNLVARQDQNAAYTSAVDAPDVRLPDGSIPWVYRFGGGVQYSQSFGDGVDLAFGLNYQRVSVRDDAFSSQIVPVDGAGTLLTVSDTGQDDLLTLEASGFIDRIEGRAFEVRGSRLRFGLEQAIPVGRANIGYTRFTANATQFIPLNLIRSNDGDGDTLILNLQGGTTLGDLPSYETFVLGGVNTIRGFPIGAVAAGRNFVVATAEYRFPLFEVTTFDYLLPVGGTLFADYGTDFTSGDTVDGSPGAVRGKLGDGLGFGFGLQSYTPIGFLRLEWGFTDVGTNQIHFTVGDRF